LVYLWFKWLHIIAVISWMAGILYLYRLLINHRERATPASYELLIGMESRLYRYITMPAMIVAYAAMLGMLYIMPDLMKAGWFHGKLTGGGLLTVTTLYAGRLCKVAAASPAQLPSGKRLRFLNEVPTLIMMILVWLVLFKPF
jgi:putative membrane protein